MRFWLALLIVMLAAGAPAFAQNRAQAAGKSYDFTDRIMLGGNARTYHVHVPPSYDRAHPMPLFMVFHGLHITGQIMIYLTDFNSYADKNKFIVVYPDGLGRRWCESGADANDDVAFINAMINKLSGMVNIDQRRIYAIGISNGGYFSERLACELGNRIAAIAIVGASMMSRVANSCNLNHRMPAMFFIGTADPLVPQEDDEHNAELGKLGDAVGLSGLGSLSVPYAKIGGLMTANEAVDFWCRHNQCSSNPYTNVEADKDPRDGCKVTRYTYGSYGSEVVYYLIQGGGHTWPGALYSGPSDLMGRTTNDISATALITDFCLKHSN